MFFYLALTYLDQNQVNQVIIKIVLFFIFICLVIAIYMFKYPTLELVFLLSFVKYQ